MKTYTLMLFDPEGFQILKEYQKAISSDLEELRGYRWILS